MANEVQNSAAHSGRVSPNEVGREESNNSAAGGGQGIQIAPAATHKKTHPMEALLKLASFASSPKAGEIVEGTVLERRGSRLFVDLGPRGTGIIYGREFYAAEDIIKKLKPGDTINAKVVEPDNEEGYTELSLRDAGEEQKWIRLKKQMEEGVALDLPVLEANRGGLILEAEGIKGFLPASQLSSQNYPRVEGGDKEKVYEALQKLVGTLLRVKIIDVSPAENKLIFSEKELDQEVFRQVLAQYKIGDVVEGEITGVVDFGAFMKFRHPDSSPLAEEGKGGGQESPLPIPPHQGEGNTRDEIGIEGLIHISEIDWTLIEDPREVLKPGDKVRAKIIDIQGDKVSLSLKALKEDPWLKIAEKYKKGDTIRGKVTRHSAFGAFVEFENRVQGLVHISEFGTEKKMKEELEIDKEYDFKILLLDPKEHRMSLGIIRSENQESGIKNQGADPSPAVIPPPETSPPRGGSPSEES